jgi:hypothetical protein
LMVLSAQVLVGWNVYYWHEADITKLFPDVCF